MSTESTILFNKLLQLNWLQQRRFAQEIATINLTVPQYHTLDTLVSCGGRATMGELARETHQVSATMTGIIDRLARDGLVERYRDDKDRRSVIVLITDRGRELVSSARSDSLASVDQVLSGMDTGERMQAQRFVDSLINVMQES